MVIDALRGIAALVVVFYHLSDAAGVRGIPVIGPMMSHGNLGVEIFFVISGFVIAYSVRNAEHTASFLGRFALRRALRLDPPLWLTIALEIIMVMIVSAVMPDRATPLPSLAQVAAHLLYVQDLLGVGNIIPVFWTLCYEVQFYLVLVSSLVLLRTVRHKWGEHIGSQLFTLLAVASFFYSLSIDVELTRSPLTGLFIDRWYQFLLGVVTFGVCYGKIPRPYLYGSWLSVAAVLLFGAPTSYTIASAATCVATSMLVMATLNRHWAEQFAQKPVLQFLGRICYSLYLSHLVIGWRAVAVVLAVLPGQPLMVVRFGVCLLGVAVSIVTAYLMYLIIERPSLRWASRVSMVRGTALFGRA